MGTKVVYISWRLPIFFSFFTTVCNKWAWNY